MADHLAIGASTAAAPRAWLEALERARADLSAGQTVESEAVFREMDDRIARVKQKLDEAKGRS